MGATNQEETVRMHNELVKEWGKGKNASEEKVKSLLALLKIELSELGLLFPASSDNFSVGALTNAREIFEIGAFQSIRSKDVVAFERYLSLLSAYYGGDISKSLSKSTHEQALRALSLLRLLSQNRIAEFHTLLETLPREILDSTEVDWVVSLERSLMEGSYSKVWRLCLPSSPSTLPRPEFAYFVSTLVGTIRNEIASCDERAYVSLPVVDVKTLLFFETDAEVREFSKQRGWSIDSHSVVHFPSSPQNKISLAPSNLSAGVVSKEMNKETVVSATLAYAKELESVV